MRQNSARKQTVLQTLVVAAVLTASVFVGLRF